MAHSVRIQQAKAHLRSPKLAVGDEFIVQKSSLLPHRLPEYTKVTVTSISETRVTMDDGSIWYRRSGCRVGDLLNQAVLLLPEPETVELAENVSRYSAAQAKFTDTFRQGFDARRARALAVAAEAFDAAMEAMAQDPVHAGQAQEAVAEKIALNELITLKLKELRALNESRLGDDGSPAKTQQRMIRQGGEEAS